jgi:Permuted papain-like amidase enzyme, YaeF/YiiX, C92 family
MPKQRRRPRTTTRPTQSVWIFDVAHLRPGDVVLERGSGVVSRAIQTADRGKYSHALIFLGGTDFLEAVRVGARVISYVRVGIADPSAWVVFRHPNAETAQRAANKARHLAHKAYGVVAAARSILPVRFKDDPSQIFCSQLVAVAYERAGANLVDGKEARQITPRLLHARSALRPLSLLPIRKPISGYAPAVDRDADYAETAPAREMRTLQNVFEAVQPELNHLLKTLEVHPRPGNCTELFDLLVQVERRGEHDEIAPVMKKLEQALEQERYFDLYLALVREAEKALSRDLEFATSAEVIAPERSYLTSQSSELAAEYGELLSRLRASAQWFQTASETSRCPLWSRLAEMSHETASEVQKLIEVAKAVAKALQ